MFVMKNAWKPVAHKRSDGKSFVQENRKPETRWEYDKSKAASVRRRHPATNRPNDFNNVFGDYRTEMEPREHCNNVTGKQGSKVAVASFHVKKVWCPMPVKRQDGTVVVGQDGKPLIRFANMGLQNIISVSVYGTTVVFKKMQKSATIRDSRNKKAHQPLEIYKELQRMLGVTRAMKGYALLMKVS